MSNTGIPLRRTNHPYQVDDPVDLPVGLRVLAEQTLKPDDPVGVIVCMPSQTLPRRLDGRGGTKRVSQQALLFTARGVLHVQEPNSPGQPGQATYLQGNTLLYAHLGMILLYSRLELCGVTDDSLTRIVLEYNTVGHKLLQPALRNFLRMAQGPASRTENADETEAILRRIGLRSFKFMNELWLYAMQPDERLLGFVFQPRIVHTYWHIFRRLVAPSVLLVLSKDDLIIVEEGRSRVSTYASIFTLCPRICITGIETRPVAERQELCIHLARDRVAVDWQTMLENDTALNWNRLWSSYTR